MKSLVEGVEYVKNTDSFSFDFENDSGKSIVKLVPDGPYQITDFDPFTYFGYVFEDNIDHQVKKDFINAVKYPDGKIKSEDLARFIRKSVSSLDRKASLAGYDVIVRPQSSSRLNDLLLDEIYKVSMADTFLDIEMVKSIPSKIEFNFQAYADSLRRKPGVSSGNIKDAMEAVSRMLTDVRKLDYVKLGTDVKPKHRMFLKNFYGFRDGESKRNFEKLQGKKILIVDDVSTTMSTLRYVLNALKIVNDTNEITMFCLLGNAIEKPAV